MAAEPGEEKTPNEALLQGLEGKVKLLGFLSIGAAAITVIIMIVSIVWIALINGKISDDTPLDTGQLENKLDQVDERLASLYQHVDTQQQKMDDINAQILAMEDTHNEKEVRIIQSLLVHQQKDYGKFLQIMEVGMINLANMVKGSRDWTQTYSAQIKHAQHINQQRIEEIRNLSVSQAKVE